MKFLIALPLMLIWVGLASADTISGTARVSVLNNQGYGGQSDWKDVFELKHSEAGRIEQTVHQALRQYQVKRDYQKEGVIQIATEFFACDAKLAIDVIKELID